MDGKTEVQRQIGHGQNLNLDNLTAESGLLVAILRISSSLSTSDFNSSLLHLCVKDGRKFRKSPQQGMSIPSLTHTLTSESADHMDSLPFTEVLRSLLTPPTLNLFLL